MKRPRCSARMPLLVRRRHAGVVRGAKIETHIVSRHRPHQQWPGQLVYGAENGSDMWDISPLRRGVGADTNHRGQVCQLNYSVQWFYHSGWFGSWPKWDNITVKTAHWRERYPLPDDREYWNVTLSDWVEYGGGGGRNCTWELIGTRWWRTLV